MAFRYDFAFGLLLLAIGAVILIKHSGDYDYLPAGIGGLALLDSVLKAQMSEEARRFGLEKWNVISISAAVTGILGIALIFRSSVRQPETSRFLTALVLVAVGIMNHCVIKYAVKSPHDRSTNKDNSQ